MDEDNTRCRDIEITATCFLFGMNTSIYNNSTYKNKGCSIYYKYTRFI